ncbi:hypothetical protein RHMOL_Rhmol04G0130000 [Rhododendron molle]|uniref:Uncharacterized protein n=1 Tax=Rhododendron molle TaxID=49168 RepID=A0ACC0NZS8_RHOML|nr:hypothetical protein RHMOL_Rhmol04G0130000 [Rhododendron molle]
MSVCGHVAVQASLCVLFQHRPHRRVRPYVRSVIQLTSVLAAAIFGDNWMKQPWIKFDHLRYFLVLSILLVAGTVDLHALAQLMHAAADVSLADVLEGALMQAVMLRLSLADKGYAYVAAFISCGGIIFYRCWTYSDPYYDSIAHWNSESSNSTKSSGKVGHSC